MDVVGWTAVLIGAAALGWAGVAKLRDPDGFVRTLRQVPVDEAYLGRVVTGLPAVEIVLAAALVLPVTRVAAVLLALALLGAFTGLLVASPQLDRCHCFGILTSTRRTAIGRNLGLIAILGMALAPSPHRPALLALGVVLTCVGYPAARFLTRRPGLSDHYDGLAALADPDRQTMVVFLAPGCTSCARIRALLPGWQAAGDDEADDGSPRVVVLDDPRSLDRFGVTATPSAVVLDTLGRPVDPNGTPTQARAVGPDAVETRHRLAVQGHDLPIVREADRTLLVFVRRGDRLPELPAEPGLAVVVLAPHRLRPALDRPVTLDPDDRLARLFGIVRTPSAVLLDRRGRRVSPVRAGPAA